MSRMIFVNVAVADVAASKAFYQALGFGLDPTYSDDASGCLVVSESIYVMVLDRARFADFVTGEVADPRAGTATINCLSATSPAEIDDLVAKALAAGGRPWRDPMDEGFMYGHSFADPDGHVWELVYMDAPAPTAP